jgi:hypothetical protein
MAWLERCGLSNHEEWALFGVEKRINASTNQVWVQLTGLFPLEGHPDGIRRVMEETRRLEYRLESEGIIGWIQAIRKGNWKMRRWTEMVGATCYAETDTHWHFCKVADATHFPRSIKALVRGGNRYGTA